MCSTRYVAGCAHLAWWKTALYGRYVCLEVAYDIRTKSIELVIYTINVKVALVPGRKPCRASNGIRALTFRFWGCGNGYDIINSPACFCLRRRQCTRVRSLGNSVAGSEHTYTENPTLFGQRIKKCTAKSNHLLRLIFRNPSTENKAEQSHSRPDYFWS